MWTLRALAPAILLAALGCAARDAAPPISPPAPPPAPLAEPVRVIAHRGASATAPENTLPAIERALAQGATEVELDVQLSRDGVAVLFHDAMLDEKTDASGRVSEHDAATLRTLDVGAWFDATHPEVEERFAGTTLATLDEAFARFGARPFYHLELKSREPALVAEVVARVAEHELVERVLLASFQADQLARARAFEPRLPRAWILERAEPGEGAARTHARHAREIERAAAAGHLQVAVAASELSAALVRKAHARGLEIRAWKVRSPDDWRRVLDLGANGGTVDWPGLALAELERRRGDARSRLRATPSRSRRS